MSFAVTANKVLHPLRDELSIHSQDSKMEPQR